MPIHLVKLPSSISQTDFIRDIVLNRETLPELCTYIASGGSLPRYAKALGVPLSWLTGWLRADKDAAALVDAAVVECKETARMVLLSEIQRLASARVVGDDPLPPGAPQELTIKPGDKIRAIELAGRELGLFTKKIEHSGNIDLAVRLKEARARRQVIDAQESAEGPGGGDSDATPPPPTPPAKIIAAHGLDVVAPAESVVDEGRKKNTLRSAESQASSAGDAHGDL